MTDDAKHLLKRESIKRFIFGLKSDALLPIIAEIELRLDVISSRSMNPFIRNYPGIIPESMNGERCKVVKLSTLLCRNYQSTIYTPSIVLLLQTSDFRLFFGLQVFRLQTVGGILELGCRVCVCCV